ncbi:hypothetical protein ACM26V_09810 [Salipaludibacillus sp. HK11]|uniref:UPF0738 family protein n=1 Tax=Salipaludibacillus sp. HK11 TaxID=3394320 RepID=UPI0039FD2C33
MHTFHVKSIEEKSNQICFIVEDDISINEWDTLEPVGRILVDSDGKAFVYMLENSKGYNHIRISHDKWSALAAGMSTNKKPLLLLNGQPSSAIELLQLWEEMTLLIENIKGNQNYGTLFVEEVEKIFC